MSKDPRRKTISARGRTLSGALQSLSKGTKRARTTGAKKDVTESENFQAETIKVMLLGPMGVGKTTFSYRCQENRFCDKLDPTIGHDVFTFNRVIGGKEYSVLLYDFQGKPGVFDTHSTLRHVHCLLVFYDSCELGHSGPVSDILNDSAPGMPANLPIVLAGTKRDLLPLLTSDDIERLREDQRQIVILNQLNSLSACNRLEDEGASKSQHVQDFVLQLLSSKTGEGVDELITQVIGKGYDYKKRTLLDNSLVKSKPPHVAKPVEMQRGSARFDDPLSKNLAPNRENVEEEHETDGKEESESSEDEDPWWHWFDLCGFCVDYESQGFIKESKNRATETKTELASSETKTRREPSGTTTNLQYLSEEDDVEAHCL